MTRALFSAYTGPLYRVTKGQATKDIFVASPGGIADTDAHDSFCSGAACAVTAIYDQSEWQNHLGLEGPAQRGHNINPLRNIQDLPVNFSDPRSKATLQGKPVHGAFFAGAPPGSDGKPFIGQGYSNRSARGTAQWDEPETIYAVMGGHHYSGNCCFDCKRKRAPICPPARPPLTAPARAPPAVSQTATPRRGTYPARTARMVRWRRSTLEAAARAAPGSAPTSRMVRPLLRHERLGLSAADPLVYGCERRDIWD